MSPSNTVHFTTRSSELPPYASVALMRSEERRVGEEGRSRWSPYHLKKKKKKREGADRRAASIAVFFFFQAEDGIRDKLVTGVQTCALPISIVERAGGSFGKYVV